MNPVRAHCDHCSFDVEAYLDDPESLVEAMRVYEEHLALTHDVSWWRARERGHAWLQAALAQCAPQPQASAR